MGHHHHHHHHHHRHHHHHHHRHHHHHHHHHLLTNSHSHSATCLPIFPKATPKTTTTSPELVRRSLPFQSSPTTTLSKAVLTLRLLTAMSNLHAMTTRPSTSPTSWTRRPDMPSQLAATESQVTRRDCQDQRMERAATRTLFMQHWSNDRDYAQ